MASAQIWQSGIISVRLLLTRCQPVANSIGFAAIRGSHAPPSQSFTPAIEFECCYAIRGVIESCELLRICSGLRLARIPSHHGRLLGGLPDSLPLLVVLALFLTSAHCHACIRSSYRKFDRIMPGLPVLIPRTPTCSRPCASSHPSPNR